MDSIQETITSCSAAEEPETEEEKVSSFASFLRTNQHQGRNWSLADFMNLAWPPYKGNMEFVYRSPNSETDHFTTVRFVEGFDGPRLEIPLIYRGENVQNEVESWESHLKPYFKSWTLEEYPPPNLVEQLPFFQVRFYDPVPSNYKAIERLVITYVMAAYCTSRPFATDTLKTLSFVARQH